VKEKSANAKKTKGRLVHLFFNTAIIIKGIDGVLEVAGGILLFFIQPHQIHHMVRILMQHELSEDPHDLIAHYLLHVTQHISSGEQIFAAIYLLWHGIIKVGLVTALFLEKHWAYPVAIGAFTIFLAYQLYRYSNTHAPELLVLSVLDIIVIILTWLEYRRLRTAGG
jgi:uncharacterized membrane protein